MSKKYKKRFIPPSLHDKMEYEEYINQLDPEDKEWVKQFYYEYYAGGVYKRDGLIEEEQMCKEARRNHNSLRRDVFEVASARNRLSYIDSVDREFMEDACDEWEWDRVYKEFGTREAKRVIIQQCIRDLDNSYVKKETTLLRFFVKLTKLRRVARYDQNQKRKQGQTDDKA